MVCHADGVRDNNRATNLRWGTGLDNAADRVKHGNHTAGETNGMAVLTNEQAREIRRRVQGGELGVLLAAEFGVSPMTISNIKLGKVFRDA